MPRRARRQSAASLSAGACPAWAFPADVPAGRPSCASAAASEPRTSSAHARTRPRRVPWHFDCRAVGGATSPSAPNGRSPCTRATPRTCSGSRSLPASTTDRSRTSLGVAVTATPPGGVGPPEGGDLLSVFIVGRRRYRRRPSPPPARSTSKRTTPEQVLGRGRCAASRSHRAGGSSRRSPEVHRCGSHRSRLPQPGGRDASPAPWPAARTRGGGVHRPGGAPRPVPAQAPPAVAGQAGPAGPPARAEG